MAKSHKLIILTKVGKDYVKLLRNQMENLGIFEEGDEEISLNPIGIQYQLYQKALSEAVDDPETQSIQMRADRHFKNVMNGVHRLGLTPMARKKLKALADPKKEKGLFDELEDLFTDDDD